MSQEEESQKGPVPTEAAAVDLPTDAATQGFKGFGSFHSDNVEDLIALPESQYKPPSNLPGFAKRFPPLPPALTEGGRAFPAAAFGAGFRDHIFTVEKDWCFINHGAFGGALRDGITIKRKYEDLMESQMLTFIDRLLLPLLVYSTRSLAKFLNARPTDLALVTNATFGLNAAISTVMRDSHDIVAFLDTEYGSVWKMMRERWHVIKCAMHEIPLGQHLNNPDIMAKDADVTKFIEDKLPEGCTVFVVDHIASTSAIMLPVFTHIVPMLRRKGVRHIVVDGAHGPLQTPLDFESLPPESRPTFYVGNLHKWVSSPKSVGFIWAHPTIQSKTHSTVVSHGSRSGFVSEFIWDGTKDYGAYLAVPAVLDFWQREVGCDAARRYASQLLLDAEQMLCRAFGTSPVQRHAPFMALIRLPKYFSKARFSTKFIQDTLHEAFKVEVPIKDVEGLFYARVSAFVYNEMRDYERFRDAVLAMRVQLMRKRQRDETAAAASTDADAPGAANANGNAKMARHNSSEEAVADLLPPGDDDEYVSPTEAAALSNGSGTPSGDCKYNAGCGVSGLGKSKAFSDSSDDDGK